MASDEAGTKIEAPVARGRSVFAPGDLVAERYTIVRFIAEGGMGEVYEAHDLELAEKVALKTILGQYAKRPMLAARFKREIYTARRVTHPNVCRVYEFGTHKGTMFLTMQLLSGMTLGELIHKRERLSIEEALPLAR